MGRKESIQTNKMIFVFRKAELVVCPRGSCVQPGVLLRWLLSQPLLFDAETVSALLKAAI